MMQKLSYLGRQLWLKAQLRAPSTVQSTMIHPLLAAKETLRSVGNPFFDIYQLQGQNQIGSLTVTYAGTGTSVRFLRKNLFSGDSTRTKIGQILAWQIHKLTLPASDITIVEAGKSLINKLPRQKALIMPSYVHLLLNLQGSWDEVKERFHGTVMRNELRLAKKHNYTYRLSQSLQDFDHFYDHMYLPTMRDRHGEFNSPMSKSEASIYFQYSFLFLVERDGKDVAAGLCYPQQKTLDFVMVGVLNGDKKLMKERVLGVMNVLRLQWANQVGFETINLRGCEPFLESGQFQYKRKWGSRVVIPVDENKRIWLRVQRNTPAVAQFLKDNPVIVIGENETLHGLIATDDLAKISAEDRAEWQKKYATPGLENLLVYSLTDLVDDPTRQVTSGPVNIWDARTKPVYTP